MTSAAPKRSLFSKPSWATSTAAPIKKTDDDEIFGRGSIYEDVLAEKKRKKEKQAARAKAREASDGREAKRRRISDEHEDDSGSDEASSKIEKSLDDSTEENTRTGSVTRRTPRKEKFGALLDSPVKPPLLKPVEATPILLEHDDDVQITFTKAAVKTTGKPTPSKANADEPESDPESDDDDPYVQKLKQKAKESVLAEKRTALVIKSPADPLGSSAELLELGQDSPTLPEQAPKDKGQPVKLYFTSIYPNTKPLIVGYSANKPLGLARMTWCLKQGFSEEKMETFFLTWNGARLFDSSTLVGSNIMESLKKQRPGEDDPSNGKIHLEVMNAEIMEHRRQQRERAEAETYGSPEEDGSNAILEELAPPSEPKIILTMRAEDGEPMKMAVRMSTLVAKIMIFCYRKMGVEDEKVCWLVFDGERLDPKTTVHDVGLEDGDVVEVLIR